jgi:hypothetical protein
VIWKKDPNGGQGNRGWHWGGRRRRYGNRCTWNRHSFQYGGTAMCQEEAWRITQNILLAALFQQNNSSDCGYFAGWALKLLRESNRSPLTSRQTSRLEVYQARENFSTVSPQLLTHRHDASLPPGNAVTFLTTSASGTGQRGLGLPRTYQSRAAGGIPRADRFQLFARRLNRGQRSGLMFSTLKPRQPGHWAAVLDKRPIHPRQPVRELQVYDSSGIGGTWDILCWIDAARFDRSYGPFAFISYVATVNP